MNVKNGLNQPTYSQTIRPQIAKNKTKVRFLYSHFENFSLKNRLICRDVPVF